VGIKLNAKEPARDTSQPEYAPNQA
jgi:hypothetical protein